MRPTPKSVPAGHPPNGERRRQTGLRWPFPHRLLPHGASPAARAAAIQVARRLHDHRPAQPSHRTDLRSLCDHSPIRPCPRNGLLGRHRQTAGGWHRPSTACRSRNGLLGRHRQTGRRRPRSRQHIPNQQIPRPSDTLPPPPRRCPAGRTRKGLDALDEPAPALPDNRRLLRSRLLERLRRQPQLRRHTKNGAHRHASPMQTGRDDTAPTTHSTSPTAHQRRPPKPKPPLAPPPNVSHRPRTARRPTDTSPPRTTPAAAISPPTTGRSTQPQQTPSPKSPDAHPPPAVTALRPMFLYQ